MIVQIANCSLLVSYKYCCTKKGASEGGGGWGGQVFDCFSGSAATGVRIWDRSHQAKFEVFVLVFLDPFTDIVRQVTEIFCKAEGRSSVAVSQVSESRPGAPSAWITAKAETSKNHRRSFAALRMTDYVRSG